PDIILLMLLGLLIGPVFHVVGAATLESVKGITSFFGTLVLIMLLLEGGMSLNFYRVLRQAAESTLFTVIVFVFNVCLVALLMFSLGWNPLHGLLLGAILAGNSSTIIFSLLKKMRVSDNTRTLLSLESSINDALVIIVSVALIQVISGNGAVNLAQIGQDFFSSFSTAGMFAVIGGFVWVWLLQKVPVKPYGYLLTLGALFFLYSASESVKSNGAFAALVFGIILGNAREIASGFRLEGEFSVSESIKESQEEIVFFVRTFFFVYMGLIFDLANVSLFVLGVSFLIIFLKLFGRWLSTRVLSKIDSTVLAERTVIVSMLPNGLAAAALASYPATFGIKVGAEGDLFLQIAFLVIFLSNAFASAAVFWIERGKTQQAAAPAPPPVKAIELKPAKRL
ncbi:MAG TPA: cation:proton antiporter, partial [archaeon]|nr:cation:proton antiporter [archaeon]